MSTTFDLVSAADLLLATSWEFTEEEFAARLDAWLAKSADKLGALRAVCKLAEGRQAACKAEAATWTGAARSAGTRAERVKELARVLYCAARELGEELPGGRMQANGGETPLVFAEGFDPHTLPVIYQRVTVEADVASIRAALQAGSTFAGITLGERGEHFRWAEAPEKRGGK
jgi:hypothetical protein